MQAAISSHGNWRNTSLLWNYLSVRKNIFLYIDDDIIYRRIRKRTLEGTVKIIKFITRHNLREGPFIEIEKDGMRDVTFYYQGKMHGPKISWRSNGTLAEYGNYKNGKRSGFWYIWHLNNYLMIEAFYDNDLPEGWAYRYNENREIESEVFYKVGKPIYQKTY